MAKWIKKASGQRKDVSVVNPDGYWEDLGVRVGKKINQSSSWRIVSNKRTLNARISANSKWYAEDLSQSASARLRLLILQPGSQQDPVRAGLVCTSVEEAPRYDALSYSWGDQKDWQLIEMDNQPGFAITLTVWQALRQLRSSSAVRVLWIDAICINQFNVAERNSQVLEMRKIFSGARSVLVWLGDHSSLQKDVVSRLEVVRESGERAWWNRVWVLQEVASAKELVVYLGPHILTWTEFCDLANSMGIVVSDLKELRSSVRGHGSADVLELEELLQYVVPRHASEPLDYVFSLIGLVRGQRPGLPCEQERLATHGLGPNYNLTPKELNARLRRYLRDNSSSEGIGIRLLLLRRKHLP